MPRGIPNNKNDIMTTETELKLTASNISNDDFAISPDGKYKIARPKKHAEYLDKVVTRIPYITDENFKKEFHIYWQTDEKPHSISDMISQGYDFVDNNIEGCEQAVPTHSGYRPDGSAFMSYCFVMPIEKHREIEKIKQAKITTHEQEMNLNPNKALEGGKGDLYATEQMNIGQRQFIKNN
jgi:hypothetical protein